MPETHHGQPVSDQRHADRPTNRGPSGDDPHHTGSPEHEEPAGGRLEQPGLPRDEPRHAGKTEHEEPPRGRLEPPVPPTDVAPDGSPVAFYRRLPAMGEPELIHGLLPAGASVLDLGCGTGRIAGPLSRLGHPVTGVDNGTGMIAALPEGVEGIGGDATSIRLGRRFDAVLLASHLVNDPDAGRLFARTAAAHLAADGVVIGETYPPRWDHRIGIGQPSRLGDAEVTIVRAERRGDLLEAEVAYGVDGDYWRQTFTARILDERALSQVLREAGLTFERWLDRPGWFTARAGGAAAEKHHQETSQAMPAPTNPHEIATDVYCLGPKGRTQTNVYFVASKGSWVLIDAGWAHDGPAIRQAAESLFGTASRPAAILLTHVHPDHSGAALECARSWDCPVYAHPDDLPLASGDFDAIREAAGPLDIWVILPSLRLLGRRRREAILERSSLQGVVRALDSNASLPWLPGWEFIRTPGHTPGHVSFFRPRDRVLITGDAVVTLRVNSIAGLALQRQGLSGPPWYTTWNWRLARRSVAALARLEPLVLGSGHGTPLAGPETVDALRAYAAHFAGSAREPETRQAAAR